MIDTQAGLKCWQTSILYGGLAELVDASDLGSDALSVWVRVPCPLLATAKQVAPDGQNVDVETVRS